MAKNPRLKDMTGLSFGNWSVLRQAGNRPGGAALWLCHCSCGAEAAVMGSDLRGGKSTGCGHSLKPKHVPSRRQHGGHGTRLYKSWQNMRARCNTPSSGRYGSYGGRGIRVCAEWSDFAAFRTWATANGYRDDLTLERVDVDGDYCPANCTWADAIVQANNRRFVKRTSDGTPGPMAARANGIKPRVYAWRVQHGWPVDLAATWQGGRVGLEKFKG